MTKMRMSSWFFFIIITLALGALITILYLHKIDKFKPAYSTFDKASMMLFDKNNYDIKFNNSSILQIELNWSSDKQGSQRSVVENGKLTHGIENTYGKNIFEVSFNQSQSLLPPLGFQPAALSRGSF